MTDLDYWKECLATAAANLPLRLLDDELEALAKAASTGHERHDAVFSALANPYPPQFVEGYEKPAAPLGYEYVRVVPGTCNPIGWALMLK